MLTVMPWAIVLRVHEILILGLQCTVGLWPRALIRSTPSAKESKGRYCERSILFMEEQNTKSHVYISKKKLFMVSVICHAVGHLQALET